MRHVTFLLAPLVLPVDGQERQYLSADNHYHGDGENGGPYRKCAEGPVSGADLQTGGQIVGGQGKHQHIRQSDDHSSVDAEHGHQLA